MAFPELHTCRAMLCKTRSLFLNIQVFSANGAKCLQLTVQSFIRNTFSKTSRRGEGSRLARGGSPSAPLRDTGSEAWRPGPAPRRPGAAVPCAPPSHPAREPAPAAVPGRPGSERGLSSPPLRSVPQVIVVFPAATRPRAAGRRGRLMARGRGGRAPEETIRVTLTHHRTSPSAEY